MSESLVSAIVGTITDMDKWHDVLELLLESTDSSKGIITLRSRLTAELVIPTDVRQELASPVVHGFTEEEIGAYITHYIKHDPWTSIENLYHPDEPYAASQYITPDELEKTVFWEWLSPQGIDDTITFKIGDSTSKYWVAINIYYSTQQLDAKNNIIEKLKSLKPLLNQVWQQGQLHRLSSINSSFANFMLEQNESAYFIDINRAILKKKAIDQTLDDKVYPLFESSNNVLRHTELKATERFDKCLRELADNKTNKMPRAQLSFDDHQISITRLERSENIIGEKTTYFLVTQAVAPETQTIWEHASLTKREKELVEILAKGGRVVDYQNHRHIAKATAHMHWGNVKDKLNVSDRNEIYAAHQLFLQSHSNDANEEAVQFN